MYLIRYNILIVKILTKSKWLINIILYDIINSIIYFRTVFFFFNIAIITSTIN